MIISEDSCLRYLPVNLKDEPRLSLEGIRYSIDIADLAHERLRATLVCLSDRGLAEGSKEIDLTSLIAAAMLDAWAIADAADRMRMLLPRLHKMKIGVVKNSPPPTPLDRRMEIRVKALHQIARRLDKERGHLIGYRSSLWGALGWVALPGESGNPAYMCFVVPGTLCPRKIPMVNPLSRESLKSPVDVITLAIGREFVCLSDVILFMEETAARLEEALSAHFGRVIKARADVLARTEIEFGPNKIKQPRFWWLGLEKEELEQIKESERIRFS